MQLEIIIGRRSNRKNTKWQKLKIIHEYAPQALNTHAQHFWSLNWIILWKKMQKFINNNNFLLTCVHKLTKQKNYFLTGYLENFCTSIRFHRKIMQYQWVSHQRPQSQLFKVFNTLVLAYCHFQIINWCNSSYPNKAMYKSIYLNNTKSNNRNKQH